VANIENLRPSEYKLSQEEAKKGGINSGIARREKATMKKALEMLLDEKNNKGITYRDLATLGLIKGAINGNAQNYKVILETLGELLETESKEAPILNINVIDNSHLDKDLYEADKH
jgi:hypothetical protein